MKKTLIAAALLLPLTTGCKVTDITTPEQEAAIAQQDAEIASLEGQIKADIAKMKASTKRLESAIRNKDAAGITDAQTELYAAVSSTQALSAELDLKIAAAVDYQNEIIDGKVGPWLRAIGGFLPDPLEPFVPLLLPLAGLAFDRPRRHLGKALKSTLTGSLAEAGKALGRSIGWAHTSETTAKVAASEYIEERKLKANV